MESPTYTERLGVPLRWWVQGFMFTASLWLATVVALPPVLSWAISGAIAVLVAIGFVSYGSARKIEVADGVLRVGRAHIGAEHLGAATALDAEAARRWAGIDADARAYLVLRPYLKRAVRIEITDPADPAPYWLISTRHPDQLARAVTALSTPTHSG